MAAEMESKLVETRAIAVREGEDLIRIACRHVDSRSQVPTDTRKSAQAWQPRLKTATEQLPVLF